MNKKIFGLKNPASTLTAFILFAVTLLVSPMVLAAVHNFSISANTLPNGQLGYALGGSTAEAVIPGPALFVKQGDTVQITLTNNTAFEVGFSVPGLINNNTAKAKPGQTQNYTVHANKTGSFVYHGNGKELLGLFGALIVDKKNAPIDSYINDDGGIVPVTQADLDKQFILFMVGSTFWGTEISGDGTHQKPLWANPNLGAVENDLVRFHVLSVGPGHTFHLHAHRWLKTGTNTVIDTKLLDVVQIAIHLLSKQAVASVRVIGNIIATCSPTWKQACTVVSRSKLLVVTEPVW